MPIPNHCIDCDKPVTNDGWLCDSCEEEERRRKNMVSSNNTGEPMKWLDSEKEEDE